MESLYASLAPSVAAYLRLQGAEDPDDLTNEVFLGVFRGLGRFVGGEREWRSWVLAIAHRRMVDERRRRSRRIATVGMPWSQGGSSLLREPTSPGAEELAFDDLASARLRQCCDRLAPDQRDVVLLRLVADLSVEQVASALGKSQGAVKALQRRGLEALRRELGATFFPEGVTL